MSGEKTDLEKIEPGVKTELAPREIVEHRPYYPPSYGYGYGEDDQKTHLRELWRIVRKRKWLILSIAFIITTIVAIDVYRAKNVYRASAIVEVAKERVPAGGQESIIFEYYSDPVMEIKTKMLVIKSRSLLESVVLDKKLYQNQKFLATGGKQGVMDAVKNIGAAIGIGSSSSAKPKDDNQATVPVIVSGDESARTPQQKQLLEQCIGILGGGLTVEPVKDTRALSISFTHTDPEVTAEIANTIADAFLTRNFDSKTKQYTAAANWLKDSTRQLQAKVRDAEEKLVAYTREHGIFPTDKDATLTTTKLARLHDEAIRAETDRMLKQSLYEEVKQGRLTQLPEAYSKQSPKLAELQKQLETLEGQYAELGVKLGPDNPKMQEIQQKIAVIKGQLTSSTRALEETLRNEYDRALRDEQSFKTMLEQAKGEAVHQNEDAIQYNILKQEVETNKSLYQDFLHKTNQAQAQVAEQGNNLSVIEPAQVPDGPIGPRRLSTIMMALLLSTAGGIGIAFFLSYLDNTIKTVEDVNRYVQLPALSVIPTMSNRSKRRLSYGSRRAISGDNDSATASAQSNSLVKFDSRSTAAEAYRVLRTSVLLSAAGQPPKTILVTSGQPGEGKTTTAINTAISLAQVGASVLIIDCDLRRPALHKVIGEEHGEGLSSYLTGGIELEKAIRKMPIGNLHFMPCGPIPPNPAELIISDKMKEMLKKLADRYDHILIDSPPLINVTDPVILSTMVDGVILVVHGGKSSRAMVRRARQELSSVGAKIFGVVLNNVDPKRDGYYDYAYYNRYYEGNGTDNVK